MEEKTLEMWPRKNKSLLLRVYFVINLIQITSRITIPAAWDLNAPWNFTIPCLHLIPSHRQHLKKWKPQQKGPNWVPNAPLFRYQTPIFPYVTGCLILLFLCLLLTKPFHLIKSPCTWLPWHIQRWSLITVSIPQAVPIFPATLPHWKSKFFSGAVTPLAVAQRFLPLFLLFMPISLPS